ILIAGSIDEANVLDGAVETLASVATTKHEVVSQAIFRTDSKLSLSRRFQIRIDPVVLRVVGRHAEVKWTNQRVGKCVSSVVGGPVWIGQREEVAQELVATE